MRLHGKKLQNATKFYLQHTIRNYVSKLAVHIYKCTAKTQYNNTLHLIRFLAPDKHAQGKSLSSLNRQIMAELKPICY